jgi:periplasmic copper chaperone A
MAAYFTVFNTTGRPDRLLSAVSGAGATSVLHDTVAGRMQVVAGGVVIPAHGKIVLSTGQGHVMIQKLFGTVRAGQTITLTLSFQHAGTIEVAAPVIGLGATAPSGASTASPAPSPSGGAS